MTITEERRVKVCEICVDVNQGICLNCGALILEMFREFAEDDAAQAIEAERTHQQRVEDALRGKWAFMAPDLNTSDDFLDVIGGADALADFVLWSTGEGESGPVVLFTELNTDTATLFGKAHRAAHPLVTSFPCRPDVGPDFDFREQDIAFRSVGLNVDNFGPVPTVESVRQYVEGVEQYAEYLDWEAEQPEGEWEREKAELWELENEIVAMLEGVESDDEPTESELFGSRLFAGDEFILDAPENAAAWWGDGSKVLAAHGEAAMLAGVSGVGKTTLEGQLVRASIGLQSHVLGFPVEECPKVLIFAMDRPAQAQRSFRRVFRPEDREVLAKRVVFWKGPPLEDFAMSPDSFLELVEKAGLKPGDRIFLDSLKDAAVGLSEDRVGAGYNRARQIVLTAGYDIFELHHMVKRNSDGGAPKDLADVYGSNHLVNGAGSVMVLHGKSGDPIVTLYHVKQPMDDCGPLQVVHGGASGESVVDTTAHDVVEIVREQGPAGCTAEDAAVVLFATARPDKAQQEKARRRLASAVERGVLTKVTEGAGRGASTRWFLAARA